MRREARIHDRSRSAEDFRRLLVALDDALSAEIARLATASVKELDRQAIKSAFDGSGFEGQYFGLDFDASSADFIAQLQHIHEDQIPDRILLHEAVPDGVINVEKLDPA